jgi:hypothetical protein
MLYLSGLGLLPGPAIGLGWAAQRSVFVRFGLDHEPGLRAEPGAKQRVERGRRAERDARRLVERFAWRLGERERLVAFEDSELAWAILPKSIFLAFLAFPTLASRSIQKFYLNRLITNCLLNAARKSCSSPPAPDLFAFRMQASSKLPPACMSRQHLHRPRSR